MGNESILRKSFIISLLVIFSTTLQIYAELPELLPREYFFARGNSKFGFKISPDGKRLAYLKDAREGRMNVWVRSVGKDDDAITTDKSKDMGQFSWAFDNNHLLYLSDCDGDENFHVYAINLAKKEVFDLTPFKGVKAQNLLMQRAVPDEILVGLNLRDKRVFDMYRISLKTKNVTKVEENPGDVRWWLADNNLVIRAAVAINPKNAATTLRVRSSSKEPWRDLIVWPFGETGLLEGYGSEIAIAFTADGKGIFVQAAFDSNTTRIARVDVETGRILEIVASDPEVCIWNEDDITLYSKPKVLFHPQNLKVQAVGFNYLIPKWRGLNDDIKRDFQILSKTHKGVFDITSRDDGDKKWIVKFYDDNSPGAYYLYDRGLNKAEMLSCTMSQLNEKTFADMKPVIIKARDSTDIPCYLTLPVGVRPRNLPLVMYIHGGLWARDDWGYNGVVQLLANRGYAVLQVNYRGSAGFGREFLNAGIGQLGIGSIQHDITDAARWAIKEGIADSKRIAIRGSSYGGYAALAGLTFTPELYACGIDEAGISNLKTFINSFPEWRAPVKRSWILRLGNVLEDEVFNKKISPYFHVDKIRGKLMIIHGVNDPRININESNQIVEAMKKIGREVIYLVYHDEGHGIVKYANFLDKLGRMEEFFAKHLDGRFQPWKKIEGCTAAIRMYGRATSKKEFLTGIRSHWQKNIQGILEEFSEFLSIPNVSADRKNIRLNAEFIKQMMEKRGIKANVMETGGNPVVYGEVNVPGATWTLGFYAHYDGQPVDPEKWTDSKPFEPVFRPGKLEAGRDLPKPIPLKPLPGQIDDDWRIYARSASDDKAAIIALINAVDAMENAEFPLRNNLKFIFEGEEEAGSTNLRPFLERHKDMLKSDVLFMCDGPVYYSENPTLFFGVRGITEVEITVYGPNTSLHSGHYGNWAPNPAIRLAQLLSSMKDTSGKVLIKGFYDTVIPLTEREQEALKAVPPYDIPLMELYGFSEPEGEGISLLDAVQLPSLNINGIESGWVGSQARTIIPSEAVASIDIRMVKGNEANDLTQKVIDHIKAQGYYIVGKDPDYKTRMKYPLIAKVITSEEGYKASRTSMDLSISKCIIETLESFCDSGLIVLPSLGGSLPIFVFNEILDVPTIGVPIANHDNNQHQPDENVRLGHLWQGIETFAALMLTGIIE